MRGRGRKGRKRWRERGGERERERGRERETKRYTNDTAHENAGTAVTEEKLLRSYKL